MTPIEKLNYFQQLPTFEYSRENFEAMSQKEAMLIAGEVWKNTVQNHNEWCARGMNWWRNTQIKLLEATLMTL
jgi:hypothetical protein